MISLTDQFKAFVRSKPADETFNARDAIACAGYQFLKDAGYPVGWCGVANWYDRDHEPHEMPPEMREAISWAYDEVCAGRQVTFGRLAERLGA